MWEEEHIGVMDWIGLIFMGATSVAMVVCTIWMFL